MIGIVLTVVFALALCIYTEPRPQVWFYSRMNGCWIKLIQNGRYRNETAIRFFKKRGTPAVIVYR